MARICGDINGTFIYVINDFSWSKENKETSLFILLLFKFDLYYI